ncbi:MAG: sodium:solute symporter family protein [Deltaproteobacteria bacterium]|nr:sodium:solute symporter family protein [Deltaproteobacteria bacterium]
MTPAVILVSVALYTLLVFAIGMWGFKQSRPSMEDFFLGGRTLGLFFVLAATWSTLFSAFSYIGLPGAYYRHGVSFFGIAGNILFNAMCMYVIGSRMWAVGHKFGFINATDLFAERYRSNWVCIIAMLISVASLLPYLGLQIRGAGLTLQGATNGSISFEMGLIYITIVVLVYVVLGGFRSVIYNDVIQACIMLIGLVGAMFIIAHKVGGGLGGVINKAAAIDPALTSFPGPAGIWTPMMVLTTAMVIGLGGFSWPQISQRMYATKSLKTIKTLALVFPLSALFVNIPPIFIGLAGRVHYPALKNADLVFPMMMNELLPPLFAVIILLSILSAIMSTVSGMILSVTSILVRDVWVRFFDPEAATEARVTKLSRLFIVLVVAGALAFVFWGPKTLVGMLIKLSGPIMMQVLVVLAGGLYWKRATKAGAIVSMLAAEVFLILQWSKLITMPKWGIHAGVWAMILGVLLFIVVSLLTKPAPKEVIDKFFNIFETEKSPVR